MTTRRITLARRLRTTALAAILAATSFAATAAPVSRSAADTGSSPFEGIIEIANQLFAPKDALAAFCASNPGFTGYLTASPTSHSAVAGITNSHVYAYISNVNKAWSCTAYLRYDGVAWNVNSTKGRFDWGLLITSTSVPCNYVVGTNDFVKGNPTADCDDSDAEYAMDIHLTKERVYQQDVDHDSVGDLSFVHSDCGTVYGGGDGEALSGTEDDPVNFNATNANNRPGANCDPITLDGFQTSQTITYDNTPPVLHFDTPSASSGVPSGAYTVGFDVTDEFAGFGGTAGWKLQRQVTTVASPGVCSPFTPSAYDLVEPASGVSTTNADNIQVAQTLTAGACYRWVLSATDKNGKIASLTSANVIADDTAPVAAVVAPALNTASAQNTTGYSVSWTELETGSGVANRSLQRQRSAISGGVCTTSWTNDDSPATTASPVTGTLATGYNYRWLLTVTDRAGNVSTQAISGSTCVDTGMPMANFTTPDEGTTTAQVSTSSTVAWTETWGSGASAHATTPRSLQRQRVPVSTASCAGVSFANDGSAYTGASSRGETGLLNGYAYRWVQTLKNNLNKTGSVTSGCVIVDTGSPTGSLATPAANAVLSGAVEITGTATDAVSFSQYTLEYGAGTWPGSWTSIGTYTSPVPTTGTLGTWDPGTLSGIYTVRLTVADAAGNTPSVTTRTVVLENAMRGDEAYYTRVGYDLGGGWALDVGVANGEARLTRDLFSIPSYGPAQALSLTYSSAESGASGRFGVGWSSNLTQYLTFDLASAVTTWHRADGGRVPFGNVAGTWTPARGHYETLSVSGSEATITARDQTRYVFESTGAGRLKRIVNRFGKALTITWSTSGATVTDASGRGPAAGQTYNVLHDSTNARVTGFIDYAGRSWTFGYTGTGASSDLTCVTDPASKVTRLGYTSHVLTSIVRGSAGCTSGGTTSWSIGYTSGKATSVTSPEVSHPDVFTYGAGTATWRQVYDDTTPDYADTTYTLDAAGRGWVTDIGNPENATTHREFDLDGNVIVETTPEDEELEATYEYDAAGNVTREERVLERETAESSEVTVVTTSTYNSANDLLTRTDADNDADTRTVTRYTYDGSGHLVSENRNCTTTGTTIPGEGAGGSCTGAGTQNADTNVITNYAWTANDQLESEQDPRGYVTKHVYDAYGNETAVIANCTSSGTTPPSPFSTCTTTNGSNGGTHDAQTNIVTTTAYDAGTTGGKAGLATSTTDALGRTTTYTYDALGRQLTEVLPGNSSIPALTRTTTYDEFGNPLTEAESWTPSGGSLLTRTTTHTYDLEQRETEVLDPTSQTRTAMSYDPADNVVEEVVGSVTGTPVATTTRRTYDRVGNPVTETLVGPTSEVQPQVSTYTPSGLPHTRAAADGTMQLATYRLDGSATSIAAFAAEDGQFQSPIGKHLTTYDTLGREVAVEDTDAFTTDDTTNTYDRLGRLLTTTTAQRTTTYTYDRAGNQLTVTDPAGIVSTTTYDPLGRATVTIANDVASPSSPVEDITTTSSYDAAGNTVAVEDARGVTTRSILNVRDQVAETIANCTDAGTTPTSNPAACTGAGTHNNATNVVTNTTYDGQGSVVKTVSAVGLTGFTATTETAYDAAGRVQASKDAMGTITASIYNAAGQLTDTYVNCTTSGTTIPSDWATCSGAGTANGTYNLHTAYTYDEWGNQASVTAPNGRQTHSLYDESNRLVAVIDNYVNGVAETAGGVTDDVTTEIAYDDAGRQAVTWTWNADGTRQSATVTTYNDDGTIAQVIVNCSDDTATPPAPPATSDDAIACTGSGTKTADANLITTNTYDPAGQLVQVQAPDPSATTGGATGTVTTQYAHDDAGRLCRVVENATGSTNLATLTRPCTDATQTAGTATANVSTRYTYDGAGNLASMIDAAGNTTTYAYDAVGHPTGRTDALDASLIWTYDDIGNQSTSATAPTR